MPFDVELDVEFDVWLELFEFVEFPVEFAWTVWIQRKFMRSHKRSISRCLVDLVLRVASGKGDLKCLTSPTWVLPDVPSFHDVLPWLKTNFGWPRLAKGWKAIQQNAQKTRKTMGAELFLVFFFYSFGFFLGFVPGVICMVFCRFVAWFLRKKLMIFHRVCYILVLWFSFCMVSATFCYLFRPKTCEFSMVGMCIYLLHLGALGCNFARCCCCCSSCR